MYKVDLILEKSAPWKNIIESKKVADLSELKDYLETLDSRLKDIFCLTTADFNFPESWTGKQEVKVNPPKSLMNLVSTYTKFEESFVRLRLHQRYNDVHKCNPFDFGEMWPVNYVNNYFKEHDCPKAYTVEIQNLDFTILEVDIKEEDYAILPSNSEMDDSSLLLVRENLETSCVKPMYNREEVIQKLFQVGCIIRPLGNFHAAAGDLLNSFTAYRIESMINNNYKTNNDVKCGDDFLMYWYDNNNKCRHIYIVNYYGYLFE